MTGKHSISARAVSAAPPARVWELLADPETWGEWSDFKSGSIEAPGSPEPNGVGAIRRFERVGGVTRERVVAFESPRHFAYELIEGVPIRDYRADVTLDPTPEGGTEIRWESTFDGKPPVPGGLVRIGLGWFVGRVARDLARAAER
jgi:hypothetical protein